MGARATTSALICACLVLGLSACGTKQTARPATLAELDLPDRYSSSEPTNQEAGETEALSHWWISFGDPLMTQLIERGLAENLDVQEAALPSVGTDNIARKKPSEAAAKSPEMLAKMRIAVAAEIARYYVTVRAQQALGENVRQSVAVQDEMIRVADFRKEAQLVSPLDAQRARAERERTAAMSPSLQMRAAEAVARIAVLTGQTPAALRESLAAGAPMPLGPSDIPMGTPSQLLTRRPDLIAAAARSIKPRLLGGPEKGAEISYKRAILAALEQVENARAAFDEARVRERQWDRALLEADQAAVLARKAYREGQSDFTSLKDAEISLLTARNERVIASDERAKALIGLYVALGGGWSFPLHEPSQTSP